MAEYNGWKNYETWATGMFLDGNYDGEGTYRHVLELVGESADGDSPVYSIAGALEEFVTESLPEVEGIAADLLNAAVSEVDWHELASAKFGELVEGWTRAATELGKSAAKDAASWIVDGNSSATAIRALLIEIEADGIPDRFNTPNLSGEMADDPTPRSLAEDITGLDDPSSEIVDALSDAWEAAVSEHYESACVAELEKWIED